MTLHLNNLVLNERQICDLELLLSGAFQPLESFMGKKDYESVIKDMRLSTGDLCPMPITLDITKTIKKDFDLQIDIHDKTGLKIKSILDFLHVKNNEKKLIKINLNSIISDLEINQNDNFSANIITNFKNNKIPSRIKFGLDVGTNNSSFNFSADSGANLIYGVFERLGDT